MDGASFNAFSEENVSKSIPCQSAMNLSDCLKSSVQTLLDSVSDEKFVSFYKSCLNEFKKKDDIPRPALSGSSIEGRMYHSQFNFIIKRSLFESIEETVWSMNEKFKRLEELEKEQADNTAQWRPPGKASEHIIPFEYVCAMEKRKDLELRTETELEGISVLKARLMQKRNDALELKEKLHSSIEEIKKIVCSEVHKKEV